jgi:hypothetical protein
MKRFLFLSIFILFFYWSYGQREKISDYSNMITTKKIILKYQNNPADSLMIPMVSDKYPELKNALCDTNLFFGDRLNTVIQHYQTDGSGITYFNYQIVYVNNDIISLELYYETMGAYPDDSQQWLTLNIQTGKAYPISKEINADGLKWIYNTYRELLKKRITDDQSKLNKDSIDNNYTDIYNDLMASADALSSDELLGNYVFTGKGINFTTDVILPHAVRNFEPEREWFVPYNKLRPYILPNAIVLK